MFILHQGYIVIMSILTLGILIFVHELGHFLIAKLCRVAVLDFSIGFGRVLWKRQIGETTYALRLIPLGGYVKMLGDDPFEQFETPAAKGESPAASSDGDSGTAAESPGLSRGERAFAPGAQVPEALRADTERHFLNQSLIEKAAVVLAGPAFNVIFALLVAVAAAWHYGMPTPVDDPIVGRVTPKLPADLAGIQAGDLVRSIDGVTIESWKQLAEIVRSSGGKELVFQISRPQAGGGTSEVIEKRVTGSAENVELNVLDGTYDKDPKARPYRVGIAQQTKAVPVTFSEACVLGAGQVWGVVELTYKMFSAMFSGAIAPTKALGGPVAVFAGAAHSAAEGAEAILNFMVLLSVSLAIFNLFPIPILDGGHLLFFLIEAIKGSPVNVRWLAIANQIGMALLLLLMLFAVSNDLWRLFS